MRAAARSAPARRDSGARRGALSGALRREVEDEAYPPANLGVRIGCKCCCGRRASQASRHNYVLDLGVFGLRNQQIIGSNPIVGSNDFRHLSTPFLGVFEFTMD